MFRENKNPILTVLAALVASLAAFLGQRYLAQEIAKSTAESAKNQAKFRYTPPPRFAWNQGATHAPSHGASLSSGSSYGESGGSMSAGSGSKSR